EHVQSPEEAGGAVSCDGVVAESARPALVPGVTSRAVEDVVGLGAVNHDPVQIEVGNVKTAVGTAGQGFGVGAGFVDRVPGLFQANHHVLLFTVGLPLGTVDLLGGVEEHEETGRQEDLTEESDDPPNDVARCGPASGAATPASSIPSAVRAVPAVLVGRLPLGCGHQYDLLLFPGAWPADARPAKGHDREGEPGARDVAGLRPRVATQRSGRTRRTRQRGLP